MKYARRITAAAAHATIQAIHEIIVSSNDIKELISSGATAEQIGAQAEKNGTKLLRSNVTDMVLAGTTTLDELVKATYSV